MPAAGEPPSGASPTPAELKPIKISIKRRPLSATASPLASTLSLAPSPTATHAADPAVAAAAAARDPLRHLTGPQRRRALETLFDRAFNTKALIRGRGRGRYDPTALFRELPDPAMYPDYYEIIRHPVSLAEMTARIAASDAAGEGGYAGLRGLQADVAQMVANARTYNQEGSAVWDDAGRLEASFDACLRAYFSDPTAFAMAGETADDAVAAAAAATPSRTASPAAPIATATAMPAAVLALPSPSPPPPPRATTPRLLQKASPPPPPPPGGSSATAAAAATTPAGPPGPASAAAARRELKAFFLAIQHHDVATFEQLLPRYAGQLNTCFLETTIEGVRERFKWLPLHAACFYGALPIVRTLVDGVAPAPARVDEPDQWYASRALHWAAYGDHPDICSYLIHDTPDGARADPDAVNSAGQKPIELVPDQDDPKWQGILIPPYVPISASTTILMKTEADRGPAAKRRRGGGAGAGTAATATATTTTAASTAAGSPVPSAAASPRRLAAVAAQAAFNARPTPAFPTPVHRQPSPASAERPPVAPLAGAAGAGAPTGLRASPRILAAQAQAPPPPSLPSAPHAPSPPPPAPAPAPLFMPILRSMPAPRGSSLGPGPIPVPMLPANSTMSAPPVPLLPPGTLPLMRPPAQQYYVPPLATVLNGVPFPGNPDPPLNAALPRALREAAGDVMLRPPEPAPQPPLLANIGLVSNDKLLSLVLPTDVPVHALQVDARVRSINIRVVPRPAPQPAASSLALQGRAPTAASAPAPAQASASSPPSAVPSEGSAASPGAADAAASAAAAAAAASKPVPRHLQICAAHNGRPLPASPVAQTESRDFGAVLLADGTNVLEFGVVTAPGRLAPLLVAAPGGMPPGWDAYRAAWKSPEIQVQSYMVVLTRPMGGSPLGV
ncbi:hypothetical protein CXG81DRAFT_28087 [Caulochytrium protostelioides]|uniref:Bromo domain-containing protein n=1 Tax=Caulochytrium protostelioides TaxID=1555241 RepID=A0A4V1IU31_9FUNG|nr:hypothetical protein CXG81DRAFT_28087 [Caulochytrium protostelioides]|eukprot:RKO99137.1 hypothetical protein CXG81DRAFT_28087 [Caulochytrium protostelioides]